MSNLQVARFLLDKGLQNLEGCAYLDENDRQMILLRNSPKPMLLKLCGLAKEKRFTFFDQVCQLSVFVGLKERPERDPDVSAGAHDRHRYQAAAASEGRHYAFEGHDVT
jgi:hypothetical protein